jgi:hypothetical protein
MLALSPLCHAAKPDVAADASAPKAAAASAPKTAAPAASAPKAAVAPAASADGFDKVVADGTSLLAPLKSFKALSSDRTYHDSIARWSRDTGWNLSWELDSDYAFSFEADFGDDYIKAIDTLCANLNSAGVPARAVVYQGNKVVRIVMEGAKR